VEQVEQRLLLAVHSCLSVGQEEMDEGNVGDGQGTIMGNLPLDTMKTRD
jgi:hypothetical protein